MPGNDFGLNFKLIGKFVIKKIEAFVKNNDNYVRIVSLYKTNAVVHVCMFIEFKVR